MRSRAFTLLEIMVSVVVLSILVIILSRIVTNATTITTLGNKRMDTDSQVRPVLDRMVADFGQMIKRSDVDIYAKGLDLEAGNDRIAFFSNVPGYYRSNSNQSPISLVAYRINADTTSASYNRMERMGKGLLWNGASPTPSVSPLPSPNAAWIIFGGTPTLQTNWPSATVGDPANQNYKDPDFELVGPQIFRFEYSYLLNTGALANALPSSGIQGVTAVVVTIAAIDPKSRVLLSDPQISTLIGRLVDFDPATHAKIGDLPKAWQTALDGTTDMIRRAISGIRIYQRSFYLFPTK
jgi:prepilin-type N-terminal cleavage/methylation domain-containing protein